MPAVAAEAIAAGGDLEECDAAARLRPARSWRSVVQVPAAQGDTVADLQRRVRRLAGVPAGAQLSVLFGGQRLEEGDALASCGLASDGGGGGGGEPWGEAFVYPNGWLLRGSRKAYPKVGAGCSWAVLRPSALEGGAGGGAVLALLLLVALCSSLLAALAPPP